MEPRAVVVPFAVTGEARGLGLGLAAMLHGHARLLGGSIALLKLQGRREGTADALPPGPLETFLPPHAWRDLGAATEAPASVRYVLTGSLEAPGDDSGLLKLLLFDAQKGAVEAVHETAIDDDTAGTAIVKAFRTIFDKAAFEPHAFADLEGLPWDVLESVLYAERAALPPPGQREGDFRSALLYLGRAVSDAPSAPYPASRLAGIVLELLHASNEASPKAEAAHRALAAALAEAPEQVPLVETATLLAARAGRHDEALERASWLVAKAPKRAQAHTVLAEVARARGDNRAALAAVDAGLAAVGSDVGLEVERGIVLAEGGDDAAARRELEAVLARHPGHGSAFTNLVQLAHRAKDGAFASALVDHALALPAAAPEVLRQALDLTLSAEPEGLPRAARLRTLCEALLRQEPEDGWTHILHGAALAQGGDRDGALATLRQVAARAPGTPFAAEALRGIFVIEHPDAAAELEGALRASESASSEELEALAARVRRIEQAEGSWLPAFMLGRIELRRGRPAVAREAFARVLALAPGCVPAAKEIERIDGEATDVDTERERPSAFFRVIDRIFGRR